MKLNTKKGGIELHADEKRLLILFCGLADDIERHGNELARNAAEVAKDKAGTLVALLCNEDDVNKYKRVRENQ